MHQQLLFDFMHTDEKQEQTKLLKFADYVDLAKPPEKIRTDNDRIMLYQWQYLRGDKKALDKIYSLLYQIAQKQILKEQKHKDFWLDYDELESKAENAATYIIEQYLTRPGFQMVLPTSYLYLRVKHELYYAQTKKAEQIVSYVSDDTLMDIIKEKGEEES